MMISIFESLFAESSPFSHMGRNFRQSGGQSRLVQLLILAGVLVLIGAVAWFLAKRFSRKVRRNYTNPRALFSELCEAHKLDRQQRKLLRQLTRRFRLGQPASVFVAPECFEADRWDAALKARSAEFTRIRTKLFGD